jgi:hypothetical protein
MKMLANVALGLMLGALSGCAVNNSVYVPPASLLGERVHDAEKSGLALAGGGTKAASYSMGILAALAADEGKALEKMTAISTVSGGGYAALFLYTKLMVGADNPALKPSDYFADCMPSVYRPILPDTFGVSPAQPYCDRIADQPDRFRFQQFVRCRQDVLEHDCRPSLMHSDRGQYAHTAALFGVTFGAAFPNFVARTVFDWPLNLSPSRALYRAGIGSTYGLFPLTAAAAEERNDIATICDSAHFKNCDASDTSARMDIEGMTFPKLKEFQEKTGHRYPVWIVNATASKKRSFAGWAMSGRRDFGLYTLQMSPYSARSGLYGGFDLEREGIDLLNGVTAAASFFDANQTETGQPLRMGLAGVQHLAATDWGSDVPNRNVGSGWRALHAAMPFPLYYIDGTLRYLSGKKLDDTRSAYIRLLDGGNNDGLGAYSLIETRMQKIFIADNLGDAKGTLGNLCYLHNEIKLRRPYRSDPSEKATSDDVQSRLIMPGLADLARYCEQFIEESEGQEKYAGEKLKGGFPILNWRHKVLLGCIRSGMANDCDVRDDSPIEARIYFMKPALDLGEMTTKFIDMKKKKVDDSACKGSPPGVCEVAAYVLNWYLKNGDDKPVHPFPQDSTPFMTLASDAQRYGAYRELGRWHMTLALADSKLDAHDFAAKVRQQGDCPISLERKGAPAAPALRLCTPS